MSGASRPPDDVASGADLRVLRTYVTVVDSGSLSKAAARLFVSEATIGTHLKRLQMQVGEILLHLAGGELCTTDAGRRLYDRAVALLAGDLAAGHPPASGPEGTVKMATAWGFYDMVMAPTFTQANRLMPHVMVDVISDYSDRAIDAVITGRAEFALTADPPRGAGLVWRPLAREPIVLAGFDLSGQVAGLLSPAPASATAGGVEQYPTIRLADAARLPMLIDSRRSALRRLVEDTFVAHGLTLVIALENDQIQVRREAYSKALGFVCAPSALWPPGNHRPHEIRARLVEPSLSRTAGLVWKADRPLSPAARAVMALVESIALQQLRDGHWVAEPLNDGDIRLD